MATLLTAQIAELITSAKQQLINEINEIITCMFSVRMTLCETYRFNNLVLIDIHVSAILGMEKTVAKI